MERIKEALEKVKHQSNLIAMQTKSGAGTPIQGETESIVYSQTQSVGLSAATLSDNRIIAFDRNEPGNNVFDVLRTKVLQKMDENGWRTLGITSPTPGCGKTVISINLAMAIAHRTDRTALLVDFDFRRPMISNYLGLAPTTSLSDVLHGRAALSAALINPEIPRLVVLPTHQSRLGPADILSSHRVSGLIDDLRNRYDDRTVIFDLPPMLGTDDAMAVLPKIDCVLLVIGDGETTRKEIEESMQQLSANRLLGTVLNKSETPARAYY